MDNQDKTLKKIDFNAIIFVIGNAKGCFVFHS
jgi:hypothetical protein